MNPAPIANAPVEIQIHLATAVMAFVLGAVILANVKGTKLHKVLGWAYVALMAATAFAAFFIRRDLGAWSINGFTPIHLFIVLTAVTLPRAIIAIRRGNVAAHKYAMTSLFVGALIIAGALTLLPGRLLHDVFFGG